MDLCSRAIQVQFFSQQIKNAFKELTAKGCTMSDYIKTLPEPQKLFRRQQPFFLFTYVIAQVTT